jgi:hypothetical protein
VIVREQRSSQLALLVVTVTTWAAFGPYFLNNGLRTEQAAVYVFAVLALILCVGRMRPNGATVGVMATYTVVLLVAIVGAVWPPTVLIPYGPGSVLAGVDNLALPVAVLILVQALMISEIPRERLLRRVCGIVVLAMCVNTVLAFASVQTNLTPFLSKFWDSNVLSANAGTTTVAGDAAQLGRLTGIFNQPSEAGVMYAAALLCAVYLYRERSTRLAIVAAILTAGGIITVSKVFVLLALPIAAWQVVRISGKRAKRLVTLAAAGLFAVGAGALGVIPQWGGSQYLERLAKPTGGLVAYYTAGRFGPTSTTGPVIHAVLNASPILGLGAAGVNAPYDNGWVEGLVYAGIIGVACYTLVMLILIAGWVRHRLLWSAAESSLVGGLLLVVVFGSLGFPVLTGNRVATVLWLILGLTVLAPDHTARTNMRAPSELLVIPENVGAAPMTTLMR